MGFNFLLIYYAVAEAHAQLLSFYQICNITR